MECETKEFVIRFLEERIVIMKQKESVPKMTKEGAIECLKKIGEIFKMNDNAKAMIFHVESYYIKKNTLRLFSNHPPDRKLVCTAIVSTSFLAQNMAEIVLKMRERMEIDQTPQQVFETEAEAIEWVQSMLDSRS